MLAGSLVFGSVAVGLVLSTGSVAGASPSPSISAVLFSGSVASPTITVTGSGFGTEADLGSPLPAGCGGFTGSDYSNTLNFRDNTEAWQAGSAAGGNCIGLLISSYSNSKIVFTLGSFYALGYDLNQGDSFTMSLLGTSFSGIVSYTTTVNCNAGGNLQTAISNAPPGSTLIVHGTCTGNFTIGENLTLQGSGTLRGNGSSGPVLTNTGGTVSVNNLTIKNGDNTSGNPGNYGGGILNYGTLTLTNSTVSGDTAYYGLGGGIYSGYGTTLTLTNSTVSGNTAYEGGGILAEGTTTLINSTVSGNTADYGGGVANLPGAVTLTNSTVSGNTANEGGGIINGGTVTLTNSSINNNTATSDDGGGIWNDGTITQPTTDRGGVSINGNTSGGNGGGIYNNGGTVNLPNAAVNRNSAVNGGGVYNDVLNGTLVGALIVSHTSINRNTASGDGGGIYNNGGTVGLTTSVSVNSNTAVSGGGIYSTVALSIPAGVVRFNIPDNIVD